MSELKTMKIIGHRGAKGLAPENTIESLKIALSLHADEIEFDVRVTQDSIPILHHDNAITMAWQKVAINSVTYSELKKCKPDLVTLDEALEFLKNKTILMLEIKPHEPAEFVLPIIRKHLASGLREDTLLIASFDYAVLKTIKRELPGVTLVVIERWSGVRATRRARALGTKRLTMNHLWLWSGFIHLIHKSGFQLCAYTLNNPKKATKWHKRGLYGVITDFPDEMAKCLK